jgi:hypothetical protein
MLVYAESVYAEGGYIPLNGGVGMGRYDSGGQQQKDVANPNPD